MYISHGLTRLEYYDIVTNQRIVTATAMINGGLEIASSEIDIKGGEGNKLYGRVFTDGMLNLNGSDALFDFKYMEMVTGGQTTVGGFKISDPEQVTITKPNEITVEGTPSKWHGGEICGWYRKANEDNWHKITFVGKTATVSGLAKDEVVCVQYNKYEGSLKEFIVPATIVPKQVRVVMTTGLYSAGTDTFLDSSKVGTLTIEIPRFIFSGSTTFNFDNTGASNTDLSGSALVSYDGDASCSASGYYAVIKEFIRGKNPNEGLIALGVKGNGVTVGVGDTAKLDVRGIFDDGLTKKMPSSDLTFTSAQVSTAEVDNDGVVTGVSAGTTDVTITLTDNTKIVDTATVTVK